MPSPPPSRPQSARTPIHAIATVGNAVFLAFLGIMLSHDRLFVPATAPAPGGEMIVTSGGADRVVLIVIDGLRADAATDARLMPTLRRLRERGTFGTVRVDSLIPSTIGGVVTLATGSTPPPASIIQDFRARPARDGGIFEMVRAVHGKSFVAGPRVWGDLYGRWIECAVPLESLVQSDDGPIVRAAAAALASADFRLVVAHLGSPDDVAHVHGTRSRPYHEAVRRADDAVAELLEHVEDRDLVIVTSDHGNTAAGGHAGPEPEVLNVPLLIVGPAGPDVPLRRQSQIAPLVAAALGLPWPTQETPRTVGVITPMAVTAVCCGCVLWTLAAVRAGEVTRLQPTVLNAAVWVVLAMAVASLREAAVWVVVAVQLLVAFSVARRTPVLTMFLVALAGAAFAALRWADGMGPTWTSPTARDVALAAGLTVAYGVGRGIDGWLCRHRTHVVLAGALAVAAVAGVERITGQTLSLSTLDVRLGYSLAASEATLPLAILVIAVLHAAPTIALYAGLRLGLRQLPPGEAGAFAAGAGGVLIGQLVVLSILLCGGPTTAALALGGLLRIAGETLFAFLALAMVAGQRSMFVFPKLPQWRPAAMQRP